MEPTETGCDSMDYIYAAQDSAQGRALVITVNHLSGPQTATLSFSISPLFLSIDNTIPLLQFFSTAKSK